MLEKSRKLALVAFFASMTLGLWAQNNNQSNNSNTPYSRYGYGRLAETSLMRNRGMGGIDQGVRSNLQTNPSNPASYTAIDSLTFLFDFGLNAGISRFNENGSSQNDWSGGIDYIVMQFPMGKYLAASAGLQPYSFVGYGYGSIDTTSLVNDYAEKRYFGTGGLNKVYLGVAGDPFPWLSLGVNAAYIFGEITNDYSVTFPNEMVESTQSSYRLSGRALELQFGVQASHTFAQKHHVVVGATYAPKMKFKADTEFLAVQSDAGNFGNIYAESLLDTVQLVQSDYTVSIPQSIALGATYVYDQRLTVGFDVEYTQWSGVKGLNELLQETSNIYHDVTKIDLGGEYVHDPSSRKFGDRIRYRAGVNFAESYIDVKGSRNRELGLSVGLGIPLKNQKSMINFAFEYVNVNPQNKSFLSENYFEFNLGLTFNEFWFFQNKLK